MTDIQTHEDFLPHRGKLFHFEGWAGTLTLAEVEVRHGVQRPGSAHPPFTLVFHGPRDNVMPEGFYAAKAGADGPSFAFYIIPIHTPARDRQDYQAVFN